MNRVHSSLGVTPNAMLMGFAPALPMPLEDICLSGLQILSFDLGGSKCLDPRCFVQNLQEKVLALDGVVLGLIKRQFDTDKRALKGHRQQLRSGQPQRSVGYLVLNWTKQLARSVLKSGDLPESFCLIGILPCYRRKKAWSRTERPLRGICSDFLLTLTCVACSLDGQYICIDHRLHPHALPLMPA